MKATILATLNHIIPHKNWFISGGSAATNFIDGRFGDIDVYFYSEDDYKKALSSVSNTVIESSLASTFFIGNHLYQFVKCRFGSPYEVFETFDLNKSCTAVLPTGETIRSPEFDKPLYIKCLNIETMNRFNKYVKSKGFKYDKVALINILERLIVNDLIKLTNYYDNDHAVTIYTRYYLAPLTELFMDELCTAYNIFPKNIRPYKALKTFPHMGIRSKVYNSSLPYLAELIACVRLKLEPTEQMLKEYPDLFI